MDLPSASAEITFPRVASERLILFDSYSRCPSAPVLDCLSEPLSEKANVFRTVTYSHLRKISCCLIAHPGSQKGGQKKTQKQRIALLS